MNDVIQWFPGHMSKAVRLIEENVKIVDAVIYVLDSRAVSACINPSFDGMIKNKPVLYCFSKTDLVDPSDLKKWFDYFDKNGYVYVASNSTSNRDRQQVMKKLSEILDDKIRRYREKGVNTPVRSMVIGIPNSGKSTLINSLCRGKRTITGDRPGVTKAKQWIAVEKGMDILDTPGTLSPKLENRETALHLAFIGSIRDDILDLNDICMKLLEFLLERYPDNVKSRYNLDRLCETPSGVFGQIAKSRGYILKGAEVDYDRTARAVLDDFRKQRLGKIMLEFPQTQVKLNAER